MEVSEWSIDGMTCASCVNRVEKALASVPGVRTARVNLATETARVEWEAEGAVNAPTPADGASPMERAIRSAVDHAGYAARLRPGASLGSRGNGSVEDRGRGAIRAESDLAAFTGSAACTLPLIVPMLVAPFGVHAMLPIAVQIVLATIVQFAFGGRFYRGALPALRRGFASMDVLVALGTTAAYGLSVHSFARGETETLYFETSAAVISFVLFGKWLEGRARYRAGGALRALASLRPTLARRIVETSFADRGSVSSPPADETTESVPVARLAIGDRLRVLPGERVPVDATLVEGATEIDESLITGESLPTAKAPGDAIVAGSLNGGGSVIVRATAVGEDTFLARILRAVEGAQGERPSVQATVDRVTRYFVPAILVIGVVTLIGTGVRLGDWTVAIGRAIAVLVIACPCALGLAAPTAILVGTTRAARRGILVRDPNACAEARGIDRVFFDKTGTLTEGVPSVTALDLASGSAAPVGRAELISRSASVQRGSEHPFARAIESFAKREGIAAPVARSVRAFPGGGIVGEPAEGGPLGIGSEKFCLEWGVRPSAIASLPPARETGSIAYAFSVSSGELFGRFTFDDELKPGAERMVRALSRRGIEAIFVSGDREPVVRAIASRIGIVRVHAGVSPEGKLALVRAERAAGHRVAMVGDGVNDAPALAAANLSIAMGAGTDVALEAAGIALLRSDPALVPTALAFASAIDSKVRQNLAWAFLYNAVAIPAAMLGYLSPAIAGGAMALSSVSVVVNSLRFRVPLDEEEGGIGR